MARHKNKRQNAKDGGKANSTGTILGAPEGAAAAAAMKMENSNNKNNVVAARNLEEDVKKEPPAKKMKMQQQQPPPSPPPLEESANNSNNKNHNNNSKMNSKKAVEKNGAAAESAPSTPTKSASPSTPSTMPKGILKPRTDTPPPSDKKRVVWKKELREYSFFESHMSPKLIMFPKSVLQRVPTPMPNEKKNNSMLVFDLNHDYDEDDDDEEDEDYNDDENFEEDPMDEDMGEDFVDEEADEEGEEEDNDDDNDEEGGDEDGDDDAWDEDGMNEDLVEFKGYDEDDSEEEEEEEDLEEEEGDEAEYDEELEEEEEGSEEEHDDEVEDEDEEDPALQEISNSSANTKVDFGRKLASNDKKTRDRAVKVLKTWLQVDRQLSYMDYLKLWRSLFFCMWMADKDPVQRELAENMAKLIHVVPDRDKMFFFQACCDIMAREWHGIDHHRLDKFYVLIRKMVHHTFLSLRNKSWKGPVFKQFAKILREGPFNPKNALVPSGLQFHLVDVYLPELNKVVKERPVTIEVADVLMGPFVDFVKASTSNSLVAKRIKSTIFNGLVGKAVVVPETDGEATVPEYDMIPETYIKTRLGQYIS